MRTKGGALDAVGPEIFTYGELVQLIRQAVDGKAGVVGVSPRLGLVIGRLLGCFVGDVPITREEVAGLISNLLVSQQPPICPTSLRA